MRRHWMTRTVAVVIGALMLATMVPVAVPQALADAAPFAASQARFMDTDTPTYDDEFGDAVAVAGDLVAVGRPGYDSDRGAVYIYKRTGGSWAYVQKIGGSVVGDRFGDCVAMDGMRLVVGAPYDDTGKGADAGSVSVYSWTGSAFVLQAGMPLSGETITAGEHFGWSVDIQGAGLVVGVPHDGSNEGSVWPYLWDGDSWETQGTLNGAAGDYLGGSVAVANGTILAGAGGRNTDTGVVDAGCVYVYYWDGLVDMRWEFQTRLYAPDPQTGVGFGVPLSIDDSGYAAIIGCPWWQAAGDAPSTPTGRAYVYTRGTTWGHTATLANPGPNSPDGDFFGSSVAMDDDRLGVVGAYWDDSHVGAAYYYQWRPPAGWTMAQKVTPGSVTPGVSLFGDSVAIDRGTLVVGATTSGSAGPPIVIMPGSAFVYNSRATLTGVCRDAVTGLPVPGAEVTAYVLDAWGEPQMANDDSLMVTGADGRYTLSVDSGTVYVGWMGLIPYKPGWYNDVELSSQASPITVWGGNTYTYDFSLYPLGSVFRFYNPSAGTHFFTDSLSERNIVLTKWPTIFTYEGIAYVTDPDTDTSPLFRFYNVVSKSHFYTADPDERDGVIQRLGYLYTYDGPTYAVSRAPLAAKVPVFRFYNLRNGSHFYTANLAERDQVLGTLGYLYQYEGPAFWIGHPGPY